MMAAQLVCLDDFEEHLSRVMSKKYVDYLKYGAYDDKTLTNNRNALRRWRIRPRFLRDVAQRDLRTTILGHPIDFPVCVGPTAMNRVVHPDGECASVKAAASVNTGFTLSTRATSSVEEVNEAAPTALKFLEIYFYKDRELTTNLVRRAENNGFSALALTIDNIRPEGGVSEQMFDLPPHLKFANFEKDCEASRLDTSVTWKDVSWLKGITKLPIVVKGVLTGRDAGRAVESGVDGILVSNEGARYLEGVTPTINALPDVLAAVKGRCEVYIEGGFRLGTDVLKALALGARAVFIGRPLIYGLAYDGENGARKVLEMIRDELSIAMALSGTPNIKDIYRKMLIHESEYLYAKL